MKSCHTQFYVSWQLAVPCHRFSKMWPYSSRTLFVVKNVELSLWQQNAACGESWLLRQACTARWCMVALHHLALRRSKRHSLKSMCCCIGSQCNWFQRANVSWSNLHSDISGKWWRLEVTEDDQMNKLKDWWRSGCSSHLFSFNTTLDFIKT